MVRHGTPTFAPFPSASRLVLALPGVRCCTQGTWLFPVRRRHACDLLVRQRTQTYVPSARSTNLRNPYTQPGHTRTVSALLTDALSLSFTSRTTCVTCRSLPLRSPHLARLRDPAHNTARTRWSPPPPPRSPSDPIGTSGPVTSAKHAHAHTHTNTHRLT